MQSSAYSWYRWVMFEAHLTFKSKEDYERLMSALYSGACALENMRTMSDLPDKQATLLREHADVLSEEIDR